jgi:hypothetical protein
MNETGTILLILAVIFFVCLGMYKFDEARLASPASQAQVELLAERVAEFPELQKAVRKAMEDGALTRNDCVELEHVYRRIKYQATLDSVVAPRGEEL